MNWKDELKKKSSRSSTRQTRKKMRAYIKPIMLNEFKKDFKNAKEINISEVEEFVKNFMSDSMKKRVSKEVGGSPQGNGTILGNSKFLEDLNRVISYELLNNMGYVSKYIKDSGTVYLKVE